MSYTSNLRALGAVIGHLREGLTAADDDVLALRDREKRLAAMEAEDDADVAAQYGLEGN
jgi:hypothetical protein